MASWGSYRRPADGFASVALSGPVRVAVRAEAVRGMAYARGLAAEFADTGHYGRSFRVTSTELTLNGVRRACSRLENTATYAAAVEWAPGGRAKHAGGRGHRVLGRTAQYLGGGAPARGGE